MSSTLRCLRVLELLAEEPFELGVSELSKALGSPKASAHRICATLLEGGFIEHDAATRQYRLSAKALWIGSGYLRHSIVYRSAFFPMQDLSKQVPGTIQLGVPDSGHVLFIHSIGDPSSVEVFADVGLRRSLHATASGKLFLTELSSEQLEAWMSSSREKYTPKTILSLARMKQELAAIIEKGYAINREELLPGISVLAAPVYDRTNKVAAAISITLRSDELASSEETRYAALLRQAAQKVSIQLGHRTRRQAV